MLVDQYLNNLTDAIHSLLGDNLVAFYLYGSFATHDMLERSDVDVLGVVRQSLLDETIESLLRILQSLDISPIAKGIDLPIYLEEVVRHPPKDTPYEAGIWVDQHGLVDIGTHGTGSTIVLDFEYCRQHGLALYGPAPSVLFGNVPQHQLLEAALETVSWHKDHIHSELHDQYGEQAILNAARAWRLAEEGVMGSKSEGAHWVLRFHPDLAIVNQALAIRDGLSQTPLSKDRVTTFLDVVAAHLRSKLEELNERQLQD
jgi:predicted nucleotidyltransferase